MAKQALIVWGGWNGHQPKEVAEIFARELKERGLGVETSDTLDAFNDGEKLKCLDLIVPVWTMGTIKGEQESNVLKAVEGGVGIGGCHGGMCDSFRNNTGWQWMTGGQWVAHPGNDGTEYPVHIRNPDHFITAGAKDFTVKSEQYYMHIDPVIQVLASTPFPVAAGRHPPSGHVDMPVIWTKYWGKGRVAYNSLGHQANIVAQKEVLPLMIKGLLWAARAEEIWK